MCAKRLEKMCREIIEPKLGDTQCCFHRRRSTPGQIFTFQQIFEIFWEYAKDVYLHEFCWPREIIRTGSSGKALGSLAGVRCWRLPFTDRRVTTSCSDVCVRVGGVKSQPLTVGAGLRQGCVLSPLLFTVNMNWVENDIWVNDVGIVRRYMINRLLFDDNLVLLASSEQGLQHALQRFSAAWDEAEMTISIKKSEVLCLSRNPSQCTLHVSDNTLQQMETFKARLSDIHK